MKVCPKCSAPGYQEDDRFCYRDGTTLEQQPTCKCGRILGAVDKFCPRCGVALTPKVPA